MIIEVKSGNATTSPMQNLIYPQVMNGNALPSAPVSELLGIQPGVPLNQQGFPNGIPIFQVTVPGFRP